MHRHYRSILYKSTRRTWINNSIKSHIS